MCTANAISICRRLKESAKRGKACRQCCFSDNWWPNLYVISDKADTHQHQQQHKKLLLPAQPPTAVCTLTHNFAKAGCARPRPAGSTCQLHVGKSWKNLQISCMSQRSAARRGTCAIKIRSLSSQQNFDIWIYLCLWICLYVYVHIYLFMLQRFLCVTGDSDWTMNFWR